MKVACYQLDTGRTLAATSKAESGPSPLVMPMTMMNAMTDVVRKF